MYPVQQQPSRFSLAVKEYSAVKLDGRKRTANVAWFGL